MLRSVDGDCTREQRAQGGKSAITAGISHEACEQQDTEADWRRRVENSPSILTVFLSIGGWFNEAEVLWATGDILNDEIQGSLLKKRSALTNTHPSQQLTLFFQLPKGGLGDRLSSQRQSEAARVRRSDPPISSDDVDGWGGTETFLAWRVSAEMLGHAYGTVFSLPGTSLI